MGWRLLRYFVLARRPGTVQLHLHSTPQTYIPAHTWHNNNTASQTAQQHSRAAAAAPHRASAIASLRQQQQQHQPRQHQQQHHGQAQGHGCEWMMHAQQHSTGTKERFEERRAIWRSHSPTLLARVLMLSSINPIAITTSSYRICGRRRRARTGRPSLPRRCAPSTRSLQSEQACCIASPPPPPHCVHLRTKLPPNTQHNTITITTPTLNAHNPNNTTNHHRTQQLGQGAGGQPRRRAVGRRRKGLRAPRRGAHKGV